MPSKPEWIEAADKVVQHYGSMIDLWQRAAHCEPITMLLLDTADQEVARVEVAEPESVSDEVVVWRAEFPAGTVAKRTLISGYAYGVPGNMRRMTFRRWNELDPIPMMPDWGFTVSVELKNGWGIGLGIDEHFSASPGLPALTRRTTARAPGSVDAIDR